MKLLIVDEQDNILYCKDASERDPSKEIARTSALWLFNEEGEILLAKRSKNKKFHPDKWNLSVSGTNEEGETYESNIIKEGKEELGILLGELIIGKKELMSLDRIFFVQYFFTKIPKITTFTLQESEVDEVKWLPLEKLNKWFSEKPEEFSCHFIYGLRALEEYLNQK